MDVQLLVVAPRRPNDLGPAQRRLEALERRVLAQLREAVEVHDGAVRSRGDDDEVAVPRAELLQGGEHLLALGAAGSPPHALLRLAPWQLEPLELLLGVRPRPLGAA